MYEGPIDEKILFLGSIMMMLLAACSTHESSKKIINQNQIKVTFKKLKRTNQIKKMKRHQPIRLNYQRRTISISILY